MDKPKFIMLVGLPGSGKSTYTEAYLKYNPDTVVLSTDALLMATGIGYKEAFNTEYDEVMKQMKKNFALASKARKDIIVDRINLVDTARRKFLSNLPKDYRKIAVYFNIPDEVIQKRLEDRNKIETETGKFISNELIQSMKDSFVMPTTDEFDQVIIV